MAHVSSAPPSASIPSGEALSATPSRPLGREALLVLAAIALVGLVHLPHPFTGDQAMFALGAREMHDGAALYRDYWDTKQPGNYLFYLAAGSLFGFREAGIHLFEVLWMLALAVALLLALRETFERRWALLLVPLLTVGFYYAVTEDWHLTQAEGLVGLPMFLAVWWAVRGVQAERRAAGMFLLSGVMGGLVLLFKLAFLPMLALFWVMDLAILAAVRRAARARAVLGATLAILAGLALPLGLTAGYLAAHGALRIAIWTSFVFPTRVLGESHHFRHEILTSGLSWFALRFAPLMGLGVMGAWAAIRRRRELLTAHLLMWIASGAFVIVIQSWSYWQYQYLLFVVPLGILAALGLEAAAPALMALTLFRSRREARLTLAVAVLALFAEPLGALALKATFLAKDGFALSPRGLETHQFRMSRGETYFRLVPEVRFLTRPDARPGPIYVIGDPLVYWLSGRKQAVPRSGGILTSFLTASEWAKIVADLRAARPPYLFVQSEYVPVLEKTRPRSDALFALLASDYRPLKSDEMGFWYALAAPAEAGIRDGSGAPQGDRKP